MSPRYLLDTNILSDLVRNPQGSVAAKIASVGEDAVCTSIVVEAELRYGAGKSASASLQDRVDRLLSALNVIPLEPPTDRCYADIRRHLAQRGMPIGPNDLFIAAHALAVDLTLVTTNVKVSARVPGLRTENWLAR